MGWDLWRPSKESETAEPPQIPDCPVEFAQEVLGLSLWSQQREILLAFKEHPRVAVGSCHKVGKTFTAGICITWWGFRHWPSYIITVAPTAHQVENLLWEELRALWHRMPPDLRALGDMKLTSCRWFYPGTREWDPKHFAYGRAARDQGALQGEHAEHMLAVEDEACDCASWVHDAILSFGPEKWLKIGNPTTAGGDFEKCFREQSGWTTVQIGWPDTPNATGEECSDFIRSMTIDESYAHDMARKWGEDHPEYRSRVLGQFPTEDQQTILAPREWTRAARDRAWCRVAAGKRPLVRVGMDVAHVGGDSTCVAVMVESTLIRLEAFPGETRTQENCDIARGVVRELEEAGLTPIEFKIDRTGVGAGVADILEEETTEAVRYDGIAFGSAALDAERFVCLRDEMYWEVRERLREGSEQPALTIGCMGPAVDRFANAAAVIKWDRQDRGKIKFEGKQAMRKRGERSPDELDAVALALLPVTVTEWMFW